MNLYQHAKNQFIPSIHSSNKVNFRVFSHDWPNPFLTTPITKIFNHLLIRMKLYQPTKKSLNSPSVNSWDGVNFRVLRPDLLNLLWRNSLFKNHVIWLAESILAYISGTRFFPTIGLCSNTANNKHFIIEQFSEN